MNKPFLDSYINLFYNDLIKRVNGKINNIELTREIFSRVIFDIYENIENEKYYTIVRDNTQLQRYLIKLCLNTFKWNNSDFYRSERNDWRESYLEDTSYSDTKDIDTEEDYEAESIIYNRISEYYNSLTMPNQILFELIYIEQLSAAAIFRKLNRNIVISEGNVRRMIHNLKRKTLKALE